MFYEKKLHKICKGLKNTLAITHQVVGNIVYPLLLINHVMCALMCVASMFAFQNHWEFWLDFKRILCQSANMLNQR